VEVDRVAEDLNIGDAFILNWPDLGINGVVMRVQQMTLGDGERNTINIECIEDVFKLPLPSESNLGSGDSLWTDPVSQDVLPADPRAVEEMPYYELHTSIGATLTESLLSDDPDAGFLIAGAGRQSSEINAAMYTDSGAGYVDRATLDFCPVAELTAAIGYTEEEIYISGGIDLESIQFGTVAQIDDELVRVDSLGSDSNGSYFISVGRGVLDTTPDSHIINTPVIFWGSEWASDAVQYTASDVVDVKLLTRLGSSALLIADAPEDSVTFASRAIRPYPPGNLRVDGYSYPLPALVVFDFTQTITWTHRDRLLQTDDYLYDYTMGSIGPEAGTTYRVRLDYILYSGIVLDDQMSAEAGSGTTYAFDSNTDSNQAAPPWDTQYIIIKEYSVRDG